MKKEDVAAYNRAWRWRKEPLKKRRMGFGQSGRDRRDVWIVKEVLPKMHKWITPKMIAQAEERMKQLNSQL